VEAFTPIFSAATKQPTHLYQPRELSLAIAAWVDANEYWKWSCSHRQGRNGEFCMTVGPVTRTAGTLA